MKEFSSVFILTFNLKEVVIRVTPTSYCGHFALCGNLPFFIFFITFILLSLFLGIMLPAGGSS